MLKTRFSPLLMQKLNTRLSSDLQRNRLLLQQLADGKVLVDGQVCVNFSCNDYLALGHDEAVKKIYQQCYQRFASGSGGSSLVTGFHDGHQQLEHRFAEFLGQEAAIFLPSGYQANLALVMALTNDDCQWFIDKQSHASIYDALKLAGANSVRFRHNNAAHLTTLLMNSERNSEDTHRYLYLEGINSMTGQIAEFKAMQSDINALFIDDAHAIGVLGSGGQGSLATHAIEVDKLGAIICPLGKAFCSQGAVIAGCQEVIDSIIQFAKPYVYTTSPSPAMANALTQVVDLIEAAKDKRDYLASLVNYFKRLSTQSAWQWRDSSTHIQQLIIGDSSKACDLSKQLTKLGVLCLPMRTPTVPQSQTGLRITLTCYHSEKTIHQLFDTLAACLDDS